MLTTTDKLDRLLLFQKALKIVIGDLERLLGVDAAYPITIALLQAIAATDRAIAERRDA